MKKKLLFLLIGCIFISFVGAASHVTAEGLEINSVEVPTLPTYVDIGKIAITDIGFTDGPNPPDFLVSPEPLNNLVLSNFASDTETFKSDPFYIYWTMLGGAASFPEIALQIAGPLTSGEHTVDWTVSWSVTDQENTTQVISIDSVKNTKATLFSPSSTFGTNSEDVLKMVQSSVKLLAETSDKFWRDPMLSYSSYLVILITERGSV